MLPPDLLPPGLRVLDMPGERGDAHAALPMPKVAVRRVFSGNAGGGGKGEAAARGCRRAGKGLVLRERGAAPVRAC